MAIYIKAIPMPKDREHPIWISLHSDGTVEYNANKGDGWQMTTAVPIPAHGRLIDADALRVVQQKDADLFRHASTLAEKSRRDEALNAVANIVNAPTVIDAEEV